MGACPAVAMALQFRFLWALPCCLGSKRGIDFPHHAAKIGRFFAALEAAARDQTAGLGASEGGVDLRVTTAGELREYLKDVNRTARTLESDHPGISPTFRLPKSGSYPALIARGRAIIEASVAQYLRKVRRVMPCRASVSINGPCMMLAS